MANKQLTKSDNKVIAGVCGGLAEYFGLDYTLTRVIYLLLSIFTAFVGGLVYVILWLLMPNK